MLEANGEMQQFPTIKVAWNEETHQVGVAFDTREFKTWDFVISVLEMAKRQAETQARIVQMNALQAQAQEQAQIQALRKNLGR